MCGIFGIFNPDTRLSETVYKSAFMKGIGRGPENSVFQTIGTQSYIGFHRLAINGLSSVSNQPIQQDNLTLICNGEIYNYKQLYTILGDSFQPKTQSDCEIILHLYKKFGIEQTLQLLDGVFAFLLIDYDIYSDSAKMYAARDPFGVRPLYFFEKKYDTMMNAGTSMYGFASELKSLSDIIATDNTIIRTFTPGTYSEYYLRFHVGEKWGFNRNVRFHIPSIVHFDYNSQGQGQEKGEEKGEEKEKQILDTIYSSLKSAVYKRCDNTERPVACLLSGGLDSSLITAIVSQYRREHGIHTPLETYSIGLEGSVDLKYARKVSDFLQTKHTEIILKETDFLEAIPEVIRAIESYDTTTVRASIGNYLLGKYIREHSEAKVIFNGDGSDELAGGYLYFQCAPNSVEFDLECRRLLKDIHMFDVLRSDKSISSHGLEPRTPFLDRGFVQTYLSIPMDVRNHGNKACEKYLLRSAFHAKGWLPEEVLWRKKEAFSDGVSQTTRSLFEIIQEYVAGLYRNTTETLEDYRAKYAHNPPQTWEQVYYREIFEASYPRQATVIPYMWMPKFVQGATDASARTLAIYKRD